MRGTGWFVAVLTCILPAWGAGPPSQLDALRGAGTEGFERALEPRALSFPADDGPHPGFRHEWWYVTGNLEATTGERFGFELTFFRLALAPPSAGKDASATSAAPASRWRTEQLYVGHFAVTDVARGRFRYFQKISRGALGLAGARADPLHVWLDDWFLDGDSLHARGAGYELHLDLRPLLAPVLNGDHGLSRKADEPGAASYYYSVPRIAVHGKIERDGVPQDVNGLAWLDREWGSGSLGRNQQGWDWFALQLEDGSALMFYSLRQAGGGRDPHSAGTWIDKDGQARALASDDVRIEVSDFWTSPLGGRYPARWRLSVPVLNLQMSLRPVLANQELGTRPRYWEGAVDVSGALRGKGYVELVGYGE